MEDPIDIHLHPDSSKSFDEQMKHLYYENRPNYDECLLRCKILALMNEIWQQYLIEKEENIMINKSNQKYAKIITEDTQIDIETIENTKCTKPYKAKLNNSAEEIWCTPIEGAKKAIVIREYENGPIIKKIIVPSIVIFGSISFRLDGIGSDIDLALPAGIHSMSVSISDILALLSSLSVSLITV